jgi:tetratricopeptide (TPR) repeat protein
LNNVATLLEASDPAEALKSYEKGLDIDQKVTKLSAEVRYRRSVAIDYGSIASVYDDLGDYPRALENNKKDLAIYQELVEADPKNALLRQGLAIAYVNAASSALRSVNIAVATDYSDRGLELMRALVAAAPEKAFQRGVFAAMLVARGTILTAANKTDEAITQIESARKIYQSLHDAGSINQANAAACDVKMGEAAAKARRDQDAAAYFQRALKITEPLIATQPPDLDALYATADAYSSLGEIDARRARRRGLTPTQQKSSWTQAQAFYSQSLNMWRRIEHPNHTAPNSFQAGDPATIAKELRVVEEELARLR